MLVLIYKNNLDHLLNKRLKSLFTQYKIYEYNIVNNAYTKNISYEFWQNLIAMLALPFP